MQQDLTSGSVPKRLVRFALPLLLANLLQSCYSLVDMAVVGQFVGSAGLAAAASSSQIVSVITSLCLGLATGGTVLVAQYRGAKREAEERAASGTLCVFSLLLALVIAAALPLACGPVFQFMSVPVQVMPLALEYLRILSPGILFSFGYNALCAILRGRGDSAGPLKFVAGSTLLNIGLDLLLTGALGMGMAGAAWATVASQAFSCFLAVRYLQRRGFFRELRRKDFRLHAPSLGRLLRLGLPTAAQMSVLNLSYLLVTGMFNACGVAEAAAAGVGLNLNTYAAMPCWAVGQAVTAMTGQNLGAKKPERARKTALNGLWLSALLCAVPVAAVQLFTPQIVSCFNGDPAVLAAGVLYLRICCGINFLPYSCMYLLDSFATGAGDSLFAMLNSLFQSVVVRLSLSALFTYVLGWGFSGLCWAEFFSPILPCLLGGAYFLSGRWKRKTVS